MLCERLTDPRRVADRRYIAEPKLDGQRTQLQFMAGRPSPATAVGPRSSSASRYGLAPRDRVALNQPYSMAKRALVMAMRASRSYSRSEIAPIVALPFRRCRRRDVVGGAKSFGGAGDRSMQTRWSRLSRRALSTAAAASTGRSGTRPARGRTSHPARWLIQRGRLLVRVTVP